MGRRCSPDRRAAAACEADQRAGSEYARGTGKSRRGISRTGAPGYFIPRRDLYLLGLLNSNLGRFYFVKTCAGLEGKNETYLRFFGQYLEGFPIRTLNLDDPGDRARRDKMISLVENMFMLNKQLAAAKTPHEQENLKRQIDATDRQIDKLVYELYGLTDEEIKIVEGTA